VVLPLPLPLPGWILGGLLPAGWLPLPRLVASSSSHVRVPAGDGCGAACLPEAATDAGGGILDEEEDARPPSLRTPLPSTDDELMFEGKKPLFQQS
jgi:hypothetical protein